MRVLGMIHAMGIQKYGPLWPDGLSDLDIEIACIKKGGQWETSTGQKRGAGLSTHLENMRRIIWPELDGEHNGQRWHKLCRDTICSHRVTVLMGPGCVAGHTRILNPVTGEQPTIEYLFRNQIAPTVATLNGPVIAGVPFIKGIDRLYRVTLSDGSSFSATSQHRVLTDQGFRHVSDVKIGQSLFSYSAHHQASSLEPCQSARERDVQSFQKTTEDFQYHYSPDRHRDDEQLRSAKEAARLPSPLQADAHERNPILLHVGDLVGEPTRNRAYQLSAHPSNWDVLHPGLPPGTHAQFHWHEGSALHACHSFQSSFQFPPEKTQLSTFEARNPGSDYKRSFYAIPFWRTSRPVASRLHEQSELADRNAGRFAPDRDAQDKTEAWPDLSGKSAGNTAPSSLLFRVSNAQVVSITDVGEDVYYDLHVPVEEHYFAEGTIHHNSSGKTHEAAWIALCLWLCDPENTCVLVSSTDMRGLRLRVWGEITTLWQKAIERFDYLPGHMLDSKLAITAGALDEDGDESDRVVRNFRAAIIGVPTVQNGKQVGLGKWVGIKQKHVVLVADEAQFMGPSFLSAFANLNKNEKFTAIVLGNPNDTLDPLGKAAEPIDGWDSHMEPDKTSVWKTRFMNGACVNLIGTDSPNFDFPPEHPTRFKYLISRATIKETLSFFAKDSFEYYSQCVGAMKIGTLARRVLTRRLCEQGRALETDIVWQGSRTRVYFIDSAYGGDRAVGGWGEFGKTIKGDVVLLLHQPNIIPISAKVDKEPEQQIAEYVKAECEGNNIPPENMGHDSTGRGSLGTFLARVWSAQTNPVEAGGQPTDRPVSLDHYINDPKTKVRRLKLCKEHYVKLVTEFWFSVRYTVEASQLRGMTEETMEEFCQRQWDRTRDDKIEIETKQEMKDRIGHSPDLADWCAGIVEMARRRGFQINKLANDSEAQASNSSWLSDMREKQKAMMKSKELVDA